MTRESVYGITKRYRRFDRRGFLTTAAGAAFGFHIAPRTFNKFPQAKVFKDYRVLLDKHKNIDAAAIGAPDHMHAPITLAALRGGSMCMWTSRWLTVSKKPA